MSILHKKLIGTPQGTTGDLVFRVRRGIVYLCARPLPFIPGNTPADQARRKRFGLTCMFSARVNQVPKLKELWELFEKESSSYNLIAQANYGHVTDAAIQPTAIISPNRGGLFLSIVSAALTNQEIQVEVDGMPVGTAAAGATRVRLVSLVCLSSPKDPDTPAYDFIPVVSATQTLDFTQSTIFSVPINSQDGMLYDLYNTQKVFYVMLTEDADGKVYQYSRTYSH